MYEATSELTLGVALGIMIAISNFVVGAEALLGRLNGEGDITLTWWLD
jgi:hypothetical protein